MNIWDLKYVEKGIGDGCFAAIQEHISIRDGDIVRISPNVMVQAEKDRPSQDRSVLSHTH